MRKLLAVLAAALLASCAPSLSQNPPRDPQTALPASFDAVAAPGSAAGQQSWKQFFADPELDALIDNALANNQELNIRLQEVIIAQSEVMARQGEYIPSLSGVAGVGTDKVGDDTSQGVSDEAHDLSNPLANYQLGFAASWEADVWKRLRNAAKAASYRYLASVEGRNFLVTEVVAEIASSYYELMAIDSQLDVLRHNIEIQQNALTVVRLQKEAARVTELAVQRFEAEVLKNQSRQYTLEQQRVRAENRINVLLGRYPQTVTPNGTGFRAPLQAALATGVPSDLLDNRPDVRRAALELEASKLDVQSARAAFYPAVRIEAGAGYESFNAAHLLRTPESMFYGIAGSMVAPLLNRRAITAQYYTANAQQIQSVFNYERTLLQAFTDVANQLAILSRLEKSYELQSRQVERLTQAIDVSNVLFQAARADYMEVLLTRRDALEAEMEMIETRSQQLQARVHIYQALGGGWK